MKTKFKNIYNSKNKLMFTIKNDELKKEVILYVFDEKENGLIRSISIKKKYLLKVLAQV